MKQTYDKSYVLLFCLILIVVTVIAFEPVRNNQFVNYDDHLYVTENQQVKNNICNESIIWAFTTTHTGNWHPLTWLSHMLDCKIFGLNSIWHHLSNLLFHVINTLLLFLVLKKTTGSVWPSSFVAAAFALHPLHVESVAWVAERKDVLSGFFWMVTITAYISYAKKPSLIRYLPMVLFLCLGLMSKPMVVTLPFVLLLLDYWPLYRLKWKGKSNKEDLRQQQPKQPCYKKASLLRLFIEKIPLFALVATSAVITYIVQESAGAMRPGERFSLSVRISNALVSYISYIFKIFCPIRLAVLYPHPGDSLPAWQPIVSTVLLAGITAVIIYMGRQRRYLPVGWLWYLGTLVPVIGLVQVGYQAMADRYTYLPSIGIFIIVAWGTTELLAVRRYRKIVLGVTAGVILTILLILTRIQVGYWLNDFTLFGRALDVTEDNYVMHSNYGLALYNKGRLDEAAEHYRKALQISKSYPMAWLNLGIVFLDQGQFDKAIDHYIKMLRIKPDNIDIMNNLAWILATAQEAKYRNPSEAVRLAECACELTRYKQPDLLDTLAVAYAADGRFDQAIETAQKAISISENLSQQELAKQIQERLQLFRSGRAYIEKSSTQDNIKP